MRAQDYKISSEKFVFRATNDNLHDTKLETKPLTYFQDALRRFAKNKASVVAAIIIGILLLFALLAPFLTPFSVAYEDNNYSFVLPKNPIFYNLGIPFWDGGQEKEVNQLAYDQYRAIQQELGRKVIMSDVEAREETYMGKTKTLYSFRLDTYNAVGVKYVELTDSQYKALQAYQDANNVQVILPITEFKRRPEAEQDQNNANIWYRTKLGAGRKTEIVFDKNGNFIPIYEKDTGDGRDQYTSKMYWEGDTKLYNYAEKKQNSWMVRVDYREYYIYQHAVADDGITEPLFLFGTNNAGKDVFTCLASGTRFSLFLAFIVASVNLFVGAIYGAIEGYYGGKVDIIMERIVELLSSVPFMIVITLLKYHFNVSHVLILFIAFFLTGWTGMAARTRMQFYRFKNQEYVLVARTLGARDLRIMFKHIFPNAIGTLITGSVLVIPGVIFSETSLSYLGIISLSTGNLTSLGTMLATGQNYLFTYPHMLLFPSLFISLLMLSFNLFGNGLRDAFNPSLRGTEE
ncbi:MAG: ABC transporter permease [Clostridia bacterium]|nr:ABC transporter permease [Clostridia bacterium]MBR2722542.1 ABC transporter permease [Clostridia bacterium]